MNLLFDLDGTLTDPKEGIVGCIQHALRELGVDPDKHPNLERFIGPPLLASFEEILGNPAQAKTALKLYRERFSTVGLYENAVYAGIENTLQDCRSAGVKMMVATSKPQSYASQIIKHFKLDSYFDRVYGSELDGQRADKTELIAFILHQEQLAPEATVMIGDRSYDILGARNNGLRPLGVLWGYGSAEELQRAGADAVCSSPGELWAALRP